MGRGVRRLFHSHPAEREETKRRGCVSPLCGARSKLAHCCEKREDWLLLRDVNASSLHCVMIWLFISPPSVFFTQPKRDSITFNALDACAERAVRCSATKGDEKLCLAGGHLKNVMCCTVLWMRWGSDRDQTATAANVTLWADLPMQLVNEPVFSSHDLYILCNGQRVLIIKKYIWKKINFDCYLSVQLSQWVWLNFPHSWSVVSKIEFLHQTNSCDWRQ